MTMAPKSYARPFTSPCNKQHHVCLPSPTSSINAADGNSCGPCAQSSWIDVLISPTYTFNPLARIFTMNSRTIKKMTKMTTTTNDLPKQLLQFDHHASGHALESYLAAAHNTRCSQQLILEHLARAEVRERSRRSLEHRLRVARIGRFRPMADFDWNWPKKIDRPT